MNTNEVQRLEAQILELHSGLGLRTTLEKASKLGELLTQVKQAMPGEFSAWCKRLPFSPRSARVYMQVFAGAEQWQRTAANARLTVDQFVRLIHRATKDRVAPAPPDTAAIVPEAAVHLADCRRFRWPGVADVVAADPPWKSEGDWAYDWLPEFCSRHLREGGLALVQCGVIDLAKRLEQLTRSGVLQYCWTLAMAYEDVRSMKPVSGLAPAWRPIIMLSRGKRDVPPRAVCCDVFTVRGGKAVKTAHGWQQPLEPFVHWYSKLIDRGSTIFVPFVGAGTELVACRRAHCLGVGTEVDPATFRIARKRVREEN